MKTFIWDRHFETGLTTVDEQHQKLVILINRLGDSFVAEGTGAAESLQGVFDELARYAREHFGDEEQLMRAEHLAPEYIALHRAVHAEFAIQLSQLWEFQNHTHDPRETLLGFLVAWLSFHILGEDQAMATQIAAIRAGATPAEAYEHIVAHQDQDRRTHALVDALQSLYRILSVRNQELADANTGLEERVSERTRDLGEANTALREAYRKMEDMAHVDGLLGIANRRHFDERFDLEWKRAYRERLPIALLMIDVDHFKKFNDAYGHLAGDDCLRRVADAISGGKRATDLLARYGGEEFVLLLPSTPLAGAGKAAAEACAAVAKASIAHRASPVAGHVTVSIGVASCTPDDPRGAAELIAAADRALYAAKEGGRDRSVTEDRRLPAALAPATP